MSDFRDALAEHLKHFRAAPFLFIGAGLSRRYLDLDGWEALLRRMSDLTGTDFAFYYASADGDLPSIASLIARELHEPWWKESRFKKTRDHFDGKLKRRESALKAEASIYLEDSIKRIPTDGLLAEELALLKRAVIDGIITTNFDPLLEELFPDFRVFVGQEELLFEDPQGVGEIYKIHGSHEEPDSLVLTRDDYDRFNARNPYLSAKLMTIFVEHPIVFLGYSLTDENVGSILHSIVSCLKTKDRVATLADRLIFVQWDVDTPESTMSKGVIPVDGNPIPVLTVTVPNYCDLFDVLTGLRRGFPAKLLRQLKQQVYELVLEDDPKGRLHVLPLHDDTDLSDVELVFGVGAIAQLRSYVGISRDDLIDDVLDAGTDLNDIRVVQEALPNVFLHGGNGNVPIYKYLRGAGLLDPNGEPLDPDGLETQVAKHAASRSERLGVIGSFKKRAEEAAKACGTLKALIDAEEPHMVLQCIRSLNEAGLDPGELKSFLVKNEHLRRDFNKSQWVKMVCLYDWLLYGQQIKPKPWRGRPPKRKAPPKPRVAKRA